MTSFRKHAPESTRRPNSFLMRPTRPAHAAALTCLLLLAAHAQASASPQQKTRPKAGTEEAPKSDAPRARAEGEPGSDEESAERAKIPVRVRRVEMPGGPGIFATIGDFPTDLNETGQEFLKREFFEHFASDVLGLGDADESPGATLKIAMLPQQKANQREGDFTFGKLSGHMVVLVEKRRVLIACTFSEAEQGPRLLAGAGRFGPWTTAGTFFVGQQKSDS